MSIVKIVRELVTQLADVWHGASLTLRVEFNVSTGDPVGHLRYWWRSCVVPGIQRLKPSICDDPLVGKTAVVKSLDRIATVRYPVVVSGWYACDLQGGERIVRPAGDLDPKE